MILALNCGSSSLKWAAFEGERRVDAGSVEGIGVPGGHATHGAAVHAALAGLPPFSAVGHRLVHGGPHLLEPVRIDGRVLAKLREAVPFAPLHLPQAISVIEAVAERSPGVPQAACFDTFFHRTLPEVARRFPLPESVAALGVRRYGFHGLSYEGVLLGMRVPPRTVIAHLGNGASMCAVKDGACIDTTMGLTPAGGFMMGTRSGDLDPGVIVFLLETMSREEISRLVERQSGLLGVSGTTSDMKTLLASKEPRARLAVEMFCYQARKAVGALSAALAGLDALVFTGGIGEHAAPVRERILAGLGHLGRFEVHVFPADEERVIARHLHALFPAAA
ncbi:MAG TPA: acetate kinase [Myxococcales bacterium]|nr:acetate kinase [Myxococcales bacterium]